MKNKILGILSAIILSLAGFGSSAAEMLNDPIPLGGDEKMKVIDSISSLYYDWNTMSISGKFTSPMLPVSATVKIYMEKDELVIISVSTLFTGEVIRVEIDPSQALAVNKRKNTYSVIEMEKIEPVCPGGLQAIQNLILGRINILGKGALSNTNADSVDIYKAEGDDLVVIPLQDFETGNYVYCYVTDEVSYLLKRFMVLLQNEEDSLYVDYDYQQKNTSLSISTDFRGLAMEGVLKLNNPDMQPKKTERMNLGQKYRHVSPKGLLEF